MFPKASGVGFRGFRAYPAASRRSSKPCCELCECVGYAVRFRRHPDGAVSYLITPLRVPPERTDKPSGRKNTGKPASLPQRRHSASSLQIRADDGRWPSSNRLFGLVRQGRAGPPEFRGEAGSARLLISGGSIQFHRCDHNATKHFRIASTAGDGAGGEGLRHEDDDPSGRRSDGFCDTT